MTDYVESARFNVNVLGRVQLMLEQLDDDVWMTGAMDRPFGRGVNLEMEHEDPAAIERSVLASGGTLYRRLATVTHEIGGGQTSTSQEVLVQDPDGYLLRFVTP